MSLTALKGENEKVLFLFVDRVDNLLLFTFQETTQLTFTCQVFKLKKVFFLLTLNMFHTFSSVFIVHFEQVNVSWVIVLNHSPFLKSNLAKNIEAI